MSGILDTGKFFWAVVKEGTKVEENKPINVLPTGKQMIDFPDWQGPVSYSEHFEEVTILGSNAADFTLTSRWFYNGNYIGNFEVLAEGTVAILSSIDVSVSTSEAFFDENDIVQLPYEINLTFRNIASGSIRKTYRAIACGDGGGRSV